MFKGNIFKFYYYLILYFICIYWKIKFIFRKFFFIKFYNEFLKEIKIFIEIYNCSLSVYCLIKFNINFSFGFVYYFKEF